MPVQYQPLDLMSVFAMAQQMQQSRNQNRLMELQLQAQEREAKKAQTYDEAMGGYDEFMSRPDLQREFAQQSAMPGIGGEMVDPGMAALQQSPEAFRAVEAQNNAAAQAEFERKIKEAQRRKTEAETAKIEKELAGEQELALTGDAKAAREIVATRRPDVLRMTTDQLFQVPEFGRELKRQQQLSAKRGQMTVNVGEKPTGTTTTDLQKNLFDAEMMLDDIRLIKEKDPDRFLGAVNKFKQAVASGKDWLGVSTPEEQALVEDYRYFEETVEGIFNAYRKWLTGAGASAKELDTLKKSVLNTGLGKAEFRSSLQRLENVLRRSASISQRLLDRGFNPDDQRKWAKEYTRESDRIIRSQQATAETIQKMRAAGRIDDEIGAYLQSQGVINGK